MMSAGDMDETISESADNGAEAPATSGTAGVETAIETSPQAAPAPVFDATPWPVAPRPAPRAVRLSRPLGPRMWTAALAAALLFTAGGLAVLYLDDASVQSSVHQLSSDNQALKSQNKALSAQLLTTQTNLTATLGELATVRAELEHPNLTIWNVPQDISGQDYYLAGGAPDTFTYHLKATSNGPMSISIITIEDFAKAISCVQNGQGKTNWCMHHSGSPFHTWNSVGSVDYDFHGAEGCADYVVVFTSAQHITVTPNISVTYNPATSATGSCA
jgi:cell division protein FtsB